MTMLIPSGIVAVVRAPSPDSAIDIGVGLFRAGVDGVEITFTVPSAARVIAELKDIIDCPIGAGTVRSVEDCATAAAAGATFMVSPDLNRDIVELSHSLGLAAIPGALTPSEVGRCIDAGADAVKVFPVGALGGPQYLRALNEPFPGTPWVVSGGVGPDDVQAYRDAGALVICMGGSLIDRAAAARGDRAAIEAHAAEVLARIPSL